MKILSFDPGKLNFGYAWSEDGQCLEYGYLEPIGSLNQDDFRVNRAKFMSNVKNFLEDHPADLVVLERFLPRPGMGMGANSEPMNIMIGVIITMAGPFVDLVMPSTWKLYMRKTYLIGEDKKKAETKKIPTKPRPELLYKDTLAFLKTTYPSLAVKKPKGKCLTVHEADAIGIGAFVYERETKKLVLNSVLNRLVANDVQNTVHLPGNQ